MATALQEYDPAQEKEIKQHGLTLVKQAQAIQIIDDQSYQFAGTLLRDIKTYIGKAKEFCRPNIQRWHEGWKKALADEKALIGPYEEAEQVIKPRLAAYNTEQERRAEEARQRAEADARKRAEDEQVAAAAQAETEGDKATAEAILNAPVEVAPIVAPPASPKVAGVSYRENWSAQVTDTMALIKAVAAGEQPVTLLQVNLPALNQMARALKGAMRLPGVKAVCEKVVSAGSR